MTALCAGRVDDVCNPLEKPSPANERKISQDVSVQKSISISLCESDIHCSPWMVLVARSWKTLFNFYG